MLITLPTFLSLCARLWWVLELATHFCVYYAAVLSPLALWLLFRRRWRLFALVVTALLINLSQIVPLYFGETGPTKRNSSTLRMLSANVWRSNRQHDRLLQLIRDEGPDFVLLLEVTRAWRQSLTALDAEYPYSIVRDREDSFGIAFFSKLPTDELRIIALSPTVLPSIEASVQFEGSTLHMFGTHPPPPTSRENARWRNGQLAAVAGKIATNQGTTLLMGDLNITPWSPYFHDLMYKSRLHNSQHGFGIQATWLSAGDLFQVLPIDHLLHSDALAVLDRRIGPDIGSDHRPIIVDLTIMQAPDKVILQ